MNVSGFGASEVNGTYVETGTLNGQALYLKDDGFMVAYYETYMPYSNDEAYYIIKINRLYGSNTVATPKYRLNSSNVAASGWEALVSYDSEEGQIGTVTL